MTAATRKATPRSPAPYSTLEGFVRDVFPIHSPRQERALLAALGPARVKVESLLAAWDGRGEWRSHRNWVYKVVVLKDPAIDRACGDACGPNCEEAGVPGRQEFDQFGRFSCRPL